MTSIFATGTSKMVPNAPYGVESFYEGAYDLVKIFVPNAPYGVERAMKRILEKETGRRS